jgi:hypothetical protein
MSLGLRLSLLPLLIAGCAAQRLEVPDSDWETVPAPTRAAVDRQLAADLAAAQAELAAAKAGVAELQRPQPRPAQTSPAPAAPAAPRDDWAAEQRDREHARVDALGRVEAAKTAWQRADRSWRELRLAAATEGLDLIVYKRELARAQAIDHSLPGTDHYDVAPLRGQFSQVQQRWYIAESASRQARSTLERASATLASAKEAYAQLMRGVPLQQSVASDDRPPSFTLDGWVVTRADIRRRRGLRHFLDETLNTPPQLRKVAVRLTVRSVPVAVSQAPTQAAAIPATGAPPAELRAAPPAGSASTGMHPADAATADPVPGARPGDRPAAPGAGARPADRPSAPAVAKPAPATAKPAPTTARPAPATAQASTSGWATTARPVAPASTVPATDKADKTEKAPPASPPAPVAKPVD